MHWALAGEVPRAAVGRVPAGRRRRGRRRRSRVCHDARRAGHGRGRAQRRVRRERARVRRRGARPARRSPASSPSTTTSLVVDVRRRHVRPRPRSRAPRRSTALTLGHWPQSIELSTVGGWLACRGGRPVLDPLRQDRGHGRRPRRRAGRRPHRDAPAASPRRPSGPTSPSCSSAREGTLGVITGACLRAHPLPPAERRAAYRLRDLRRRHRRVPAHPAAGRHAGRAAPLRRGRVGRGRTAATARRACCSCSTRPTTPSSTPRCRRGATSAPTPPALDDGLVERWLEHRNDVSALEALTRKGFVVDTMEIAGAVGAAAARSTTSRWPRCSPSRTPGSPPPTCSHSYPDGACLYFTFAATPPPDDVEHDVRRPVGRRHRAPCSPHGGTLSHHHGVGLNRARFVAEALGAASAVLAAVEGGARSARASSTRASSACRRRSGRWRWPG